MYSEQDLTAVGLINEDALDQELINYPQYLEDANYLYARALDKRDTCRAELKRMEAQLTFKYRKRYARMNERITDKIIALEVVRDDEYQEIEDRLLKATRKCNELQGLRDSIERRGSALGKLAGLFQAGYWARSSVTGGSVDEVKYQAKRKRLADRRRQRDRVPIRRPPPSR